MQIGIPSATNFLENSSKLFVQADASSLANGIKVKHSAIGTHGIKIVEFDDNEKAFGVFKTQNSNSDGVDKFNIRGDGKTQIGDNANAPYNAQLSLNVSTGIDALSVYNTLTSSRVFGVDGSGRAHLGRNLQIGTSSSAIQDPSTRLLIDLDTNNPNYGIRFSTNNTSIKAISISNSLLQTSPFTVMSDGKTQIGEEIQGSGAYALTVNGKVGAREIKVTLSSPWPDYVFEKNYKLQDLDIVQKYVKENKHLPNIPSAEELKKEECGLDLAEMQGKQMEKIEDIYLYLFEMKKEIEKLKRENIQLKKQNKK